MNELVSVLCWCDCLYKEEKEKCFLPGLSTPVLLGYRRRLRANPPAASVFAPIYAANDSCSCCIQRERMECVALAAAQQICEGKL
jgi:hypothetical protein